MTENPHMEKPVVVKLRLFGWSESMVLSDLRGESARMMNNARNWSDWSSIFTDEAGAYKAQTTPEFRRRHPFYVRSNVMISMDDYMEFQKEMQTLNGMYEIPVGEEIKWSDLWEKLRSRPRTPAIAAITEDRLKGYYRKVFECASQKDSLQYIFTITNVYEQYCLLEERHIYKFHLQEAFQRVQMDLRPRNEFAVFIMDELNAETIKQIKAVCHEFTVNGDFIRNYGNVYHNNPCASLTACGNRVLHWKHSESNRAGHFHAVHQTAA